MIADSRNRELFHECATVRLPNQRCFDGKDPITRSSRCLTPALRRPLWKPPDGFLSPVLCRPAEICPGRASTSRHAMPFHPRIASHCIALHNTSAGAREGARARRRPLGKHPVSNLISMDRGFGGRRGGKFADSRGKLGPLRPGKLTTEDLGGAGGGGRDAV